MAGDWIKMRTSLVKAPQVIRLAADLKKSKAEILGALFLLWVIADESSLEGVIKFGASHLDKELDIDGFSYALQKVGWLVEENEYQIKLVNYGEHNGPTGRRRAEDYKRAREKRREEKADKTRQDKDKVRTECGQNAGQIKLEEELEKELEEELEEEKEEEKEKRNVKMEIFAINPEEKSFVGHEQAQSLALAWKFMRRGVCASESGQAVYEHFLEALRHGLDYQKTLAEINNSKRKRTEYLWQFTQRTQLPSSSQGNLSLEKALERMAGDINKSNILGVAFNGN